MEEEFRVCVLVGFGGCGFWCCFFGLFWVVFAVGCYFAYELGGFLGLFGLFVVVVLCFVDVVVVFYVS